MWIRVVADAIIAVFASICVIALFSVLADILFYPKSLKENPFCLFIQRIINRKL